MLGRAGHGQQVTILLLWIPAFLLMRSQKKEVAYSSAALAGVLGALCLWRGFRTSDGDEEGAAKKK